MLRVLSWLILLLLCSSFATGFRLFMSTTQTRSSPQIRGSSSGAVIELKDVCISIGNNDILTNVNWQILPKERWALVGRNGEGKSTLLKACLLNYMSNEMISLRSGEILMSQQHRLGYLEQKVLTHSPNHLLTHSPNHLLTQGCIGINADCQTRS